MTDNRESGPDIFLDALNLPAEDASPNRESGADETVEAEKTDDEELELSLDDEEGAEESNDAKVEKFEIKAYGKTVELGIDELKEYAQKGVSFEEERTKLRTQHNTMLSEVATERKKIEAEAERLGELLEVFGQSEKAKEHLEFLMENDLPEYKRQKALLDEIAEKSASIKTAKRDAEISEGVELLSTTFPQEWADAKKRAELLGEAAAMFDDVGLPRDTTTDGKVYLLAIKAHRAMAKADKYDALVEKAKNAKNTAPKKLPNTSGMKAKAPAADDFDVVSEGWKTK